MHTKTKRHAFGEESATWSKIYLWAQPASGPAGALKFATESSFLFCCLVFIALTFESLVFYRRKCATKNDDDGLFTFSPLLRSPFAQTAHEQYSEGVSGRTKWNNKWENELCRQRNDLSTQSDCWFTYFSSRRIACFQGNPTTSFFLYHLFDSQNAFFITIIYSDIESRHLHAIKWEHWRTRKFFSSRKMVVVPPLPDSTIDAWSHSDISNFLGSCSAAPIRSTSIVDCKYN